MVFAFCDIHLRTNDISFIHEVVKFKRWINETNCISQFAVCLC